MTTSLEKWVKEALNDDTLVADALVRLRAPPLRPIIRVEWTVRQPRSRKAGPARGSPTTPLSWSGGATSHSAADGLEDTSFSFASRPLMDPPRSKVLAGTSEATTTKRSRKKKTLAELKEEESMLLKERRGLKNELATLRLRFESERAKNESLKRRKLDMQSHQTFKSLTSSVASEETISDQLQHLEADSVATPSKFSADTKNLYLDTAPRRLLLNCSKVEEVMSQDTGFLLPDLNVPLDDESVSKALCGMS